MFGELRGTSPGELKEKDAIKKLNGTEVLKSIRVYIRLRNYPAEMWPMKGGFQKELANNAASRQTETNVKIILRP